MNKHNNCEYCGWFLALVSRECYNKECIAFYEIKDLKKVTK